MAERNFAMTDLTTFLLAFGQPSQKDSRALLLTGDHRYDARFQKLKRFPERLADDATAASKRRSRGRCTRAMFPFLVI
jgi:hypothetical protein